MKGFSACVRAVGLAGSLLEEMGQGLGLLDHPVGADELIELHDELGRCDTVEEFLQSLR